MIRNRSLEVALLSRCGVRLSSLCWLGALTTLFCTCIDPRDDDQPVRGNVTTVAPPGSMDQPAQGPSLQGEDAADTEGRAPEAPAGSFDAGTVDAGVSDLDAAGMPDSGASSGDAMAIE